MRASLWPSSSNLSGSGDEKSGDRHRVLRSGVAAILPLTDLRFLVIFVLECWTVMS